MRKKRALGVLVALIPAIFIFFTMFSIELVSSPSAKEIKADTSVDTSLDLSEEFITLLIGDRTDESIEALNTVEKNWHIGLMPFVLEVMSFAQPSPEIGKLQDLMRKEAGIGKSKEMSVNDWYVWLWNQDAKAAPGYANFKADLYRNIDRKFEKYFEDRQETAQIRLDEIRWGGVIQDGIPPLRDPEMISIKEADYLEDDNVVFGIEINGDARAYPKRILAWHEMFTDNIGGVEIAGVYCTLCGTVIPYKTKFKGKQYTLGTSGFLYRSNKLMYDKATQSMWSTTRGVPVLGPLVGKGIELEFESVVTTTWGEWRKRHPDTTVLSLNTGHTRDYGEGVAYNDYFSSDRLMFNTPFMDDRLKNKREVLALRFAAAPGQQLAIDTKFLDENHVYENKIGQQSFVVLTDNSGANRVYDPKGLNFESYDRESLAVDGEGGEWQVKEQWLLSKDGTKLPRLPYHRAFWFGWRAAFPETQLIN